MQVKNPELTDEQVSNIFNYPILPVSISVSRILYT